MKHKERVKFKYGKLTIDPYNLILVEYTPRMLMLHLYYFLMNEKLFFLTNMVFVFQYFPLTNPSLL